LIDKKNILFEIIYYWMDSWWWTWIFLSMSYSERSRLNQKRKRYSNLIVSFAGGQNSSSGW